MYNAKDVEERPRLGPRLLAGEKAGAETPSGFRGAEVMGDDI